MRRRLNPTRPGKVLNMNASIASFLRFHSRMSTLDMTLGVLEVPILISSVLYGATCLQTYLYTERSFRDPRWLHFMVCTINLFSGTYSSVFLLGRVRVVSIYSS
jgi:hypothetical protein